jgi:hypothetical protein
MSGIVHFERKGNLAPEVFEASITLCGITKDKTMHVSWTRMEYISKVIESLNNIIDVQKLKDGKKYKIYGITSEGIMMESMYKNGKISSSYIGKERIEEVIKRRLQR